MTATKIDFHNDIHQLEFSRHEDHSGALDSVDGVLDSYKELLREEGATNVSLVMTYLTPNSQVALERMTLAPPSETDPQYRVFADGLLTEVVEQRGAIDLFHRLSDAMWIGITDDEQGDARVQEFDPCEDNNTIRLEVQRNG